MFSVRPVTPTLTPSPSETTIESGTSLTLTCATTSTGTITYIFKKDGTAVQTSAAATYTIPSPTTSDTAAYLCVAQITAVDSHDSGTHSLTVVGE